MTTNDYVREHFNELAKFCPGLKLERVLEGAVQTVDVMGQPKGFISLEVSGSSLRVVALFLERGAPQALFHKLAETVIGYANDIGAKKIEFDTTRKGWVKRLERYGFEPMPYYRMIRSSNHGQ